MLYNNTRLKQRRRDLRNNQTQAERTMWSMLKNKQVNGFRFLRQYSVGPYILDFYCPKLRLAIEIDGSQHSEKNHQNYDNERTHYLKMNNIVECRFWNNEVTGNKEGVYEKLLEICKTAVAPS